MVVIDVTLGIKQMYSADYLGECRMLCMHVNTMAGSASASKRVECNFMLVAW